MNYPELRASMARKSLSVSAVSDAIGISNQAFYNKVHGKTEFRNSEIKKIAEVLSLSMDDVNMIFFNV